MHKVLQNPCGFQFRMQRIRSRNAPIHVTAAGAGRNLRRVNSPLHLRVALPLLCLGFQVFLCGTFSGQTMEKPPYLGHTALWGGATIAAGGDISHVLGIQ